MKTYDIHRDIVVGDQRHRSGTTVELELAPALEKAWVDNGAICVVLDPAPDAAVAAAPAPAIEPAQPDPSEPASEPVHVLTAGDGATAHDV